MTALHGPARIGSRWATWVAWIAILAPLPYSLSRVLWAMGVPVGTTTQGLRDIDIPGSGARYVLMLAVLTEATALFVHRFVLARARTLPRRLPLVGGRAVRPRMVVGVLVVPILILA